MARLLALILAALCGGAAPVTAADRLDLSYAVYTGGFHVMNMELEIGLDHQAYDVTARYRTVGLLSWVLPWSSVARSEGRVHNSAVQPVFHRVEGKVHGRVRTVRIADRDGLVDEVELMPPPGDDWDREAVGEAERRHAADPMSMIIAALRDLEMTGECRGNRPVFDGRRRYDLEFSDGGRQRLERSSKSIFEGEARLCAFLYRPVHGYVRHQADPTIKYERTGRVWLASPMPGAPLAPIRMEMDSTFGMTIIHLRGASPRTEGGGAPPPGAAGANGG